MSLKALCHKKADIINGWGKIFVGEKLRQLLKISSISPDKFFPDKVLPKRIESILISNCSKYELLW